MEKLPALASSLSRGAVSWHGRRDADFPNSRRRTSFRVQCISILSFSHNSGLTECEQEPFVICPLRGCLLFVVRVRSVRFDML
ncbi:unnamed protein product [Phyllotreta striolata]|uniref:Uncharacterized protein n=1 Tax=Phyllotreta striolata TaxID=444603 RepID=A0A9N9XQP8_PHYSR|nr:unnamed protein product [Phyllotreta striolata]